ncbi:hypothetical protein EC991_011258, partial [Linnemannia zychae]
EPVAAATSESIESGAQDFASAWAHKHRKHRHHHHSRHQQNNRHGHNQSVCKAKFEKARRNFYKTIASSRKALALLDISNSGASANAIQLGLELSNALDIAENAAAILGSSSRCQNALTGAQFGLSVCEKVNATTQLRLGGCRQHEQQAREALAESTNAVSTCKSSLSSCQGTTESCNNQLSVCQSENTEAAKALEQAASMQKDCDSKLSS